MYVAALRVTSFLQVVEKIVVFGITLTNRLHSDRLLLFDIENDVSVFFTLFDFFKVIFASPKPSTT
jgi:hypothetical protein